MLKAFPFWSAPTVCKKSLLQVCKWDGNPHHYALFQGYGVYKHSQVPAHIKGYIPVKWTQQHLTVDNLHHVWRAKVAPRAHRSSLCNIISLYMAFLSNKCVVLSVNFSPQHHDLCRAECRQFYCSLSL